MKAAAPVVVALSVIAVSCGHHRPAPEAAGVLQLHSTLDTSGGLYIEGFVWNLDVSHVDGGRHLTRRPRSATARFELPPGRYRVKSNVQPCDGNCSILDGVTDGCSAEVTIGPGETVRRTIRMKPSTPCRIE